MSVSQSLVSEDGEASVKIPPFYFPLGRPAISAEAEADNTLKLARDYLKRSSVDEKLQLTDMHVFAKVAFLNVYMYMDVHEHGIYELHELCIVDVLLCGIPTSTV